MATSLRSIDGGKSRGPYARAAASVMGLAVLSLAGAAVANSRAPLFVPWIPSTAPRALSEDVVAEHEMLVFRCDEVRCRVKASYRVRAGSAQQVELRFVLPVKAPVTAKFGSASGTVTVAGAPTATAAEVLEKIPLNYPMSQRLPFYEASVEGPLKPGINEVSFEYVQPLGGQGRSEASMTRFFHYGLWPLREWKRAKDFSLEFTATLSRPAPSWWQRWFGTVREMDCSFGDRVTLDPPPLSLRRTQRKDTLWLHARVPLPVIPETISCYIADD
jgi:hypothetical protein